MSISEKEEFTMALGGKAELKKVLNRLVKEQEILRLEIEQLILESILSEHGELTSKERATWRIIDRMPGQHDVLFDTDCADSPYGMHGRARKSILTSCVWCTLELDDR